MVFPRLKDFHSLLQCSSTFEYHCQSQGCSHQLSYGHIVSYFFSSSILALPNYPQYINYQYLYERMLSLLHELSVAFLILLSCCYTRKNTTTSTTTILRGTSTTTATYFYHCYYHYCYQNYQQCYNNCCYCSQHISLHQQQSIAPCATIS